MLVKGRYVVVLYVVEDDSKMHQNFEKIDSLFQQTSSLKPYVSNVILEKIIIDLEDEVVNLLEKEKVNLETIESLKLKSFESSEKVSSESENQSENDCHKIEKVCDKEENPKVIAPGIFKLNVSQCVSSISMSKSSCDSKNVEIKLKRKRRKRKSSKQNVKQVYNDVSRDNNDFVHFSDLDTFSSGRPRHRDVIWKKKGSSNTSNVGLSAVSVSNLNKNVKRFLRKDLLACNNSHLGETSSAYMCNDAMNVSCDSRMNDLIDDNNFFIFDDVNVRISPVSKVSFRKKPRDSMHIYLWIIDSGCSKHMTGNHALLTNFVKKFLGTVRFGNNDFAVIAGYGDVVIGSMTIKKVYYVEGLGHNLFSVGQFCDKGLEVSFRKSTCFVRNGDGVDLLTGDRSSNLYTIALNEVASNSWTCLLAKASSSQSWLWHQRLSYLNFTTINNLVKNNLVQGLPKMKIEKDHFCSTCEQGKIHRKHHKSKTAFASNKPLYLLHMDLCRPMRVQSINGKRYMLVVVDDYSRYTWHVRTDNGTEFKNKTLAKFFDEVGITQQFFAARTPQQNGAVERRNRTLVEAARTMLAFIMKSPTTNVETPIIEEVFHEVSKSFQRESSPSYLNDDMQHSPEEVVLHQTNTQSIPINMVSNGDEASTSHNVFNERLEDAYIDASIVFHDPSNFHTFYQPYPHEKRPEGKSVIKTKWIFKNKKDESSLVIRNKARLVVVGYSQQKGVDYDETFAPVTRIEAIRLFLAYATHKDFTVFQMEEEVYVGQPLGFVSKQYPDYVYALDKALYGLKQAPRAWYDVLSQFLIKSGFQKGFIDTTLFIKKKAESEYVAVSSCCAQVLWMRTQLTDYGFFYDKVPIYCDSKSAIAISCNLVQHTQTKHIDMRYHFIKDHVEKER
uniref:Retrovirus-related Pol polyprotein from transposon TNT 1-94 n=1 Tax=Tanacetum cinerariifolium TaxID=118510 RepID=A0A6L2J0W4_TANCI|nr:retrovirus-related Pol polyprotein from transposon TNT 1-94 [Tanacetum cinerariifolium]